MATVPRVGIYRGFIFVSLAPTGVSFEEHLGPNGHVLIDRCCDAAPDGEITVKSGALLHQMNCNWKMIVENDTDGYHPPFVHSSLFKAHAARPGSRLSRMRPAAGAKAPALEAPVEAPKSLGVVRDWNDGHAELDGRDTMPRSGLGYLQVGLRLLPLKDLPRREKLFVQRPGLADLSTRRSSCFSAIHSPSPLRSP